jgi:ribosome-binding ATPase
MMALDIGIIGLPNVGKSTLFNALAQTQAEASNYAFCTVEPNVGVVEIPDARLDALASLLQPASTTPTSIRFVDLAGLVRGASRGEGLGNRFLASIREADALVHVLRCFDDEEIAHVDGAVDPVRDAATVEMELLLADLECAEQALPRLEKIAQTNPRSPERHTHEVLHSIWEGLGEGVRVADMSLPEEALGDVRSFNFLTLKPVFYVANVAESELPDGGPLAQSAREHLGSARVLAVAARLEAELAQLERAERLEFMEALGMTQSGVERLALAGYALLDLITFYTMANKKLQAWQVTRGTQAPRAAGRIHGDMEEGFIRAEVVSCDDLLRDGNLAAVREEGKLRTEGRDYAVQDGDVVNFLFKS